MKTTPALVLFAAALFAAGCQNTATTAAAPAVSPDAITVNFKDPDSFTDVRDTLGGGTSQVYLDLLSQRLKELAGKRLAAGQKLSVTFTDIDLAGDIPPGSVNSVRIIKPIYIPRMTLTFRLTDAAGAVLKEGERKLTDLNFQMNMLPLTDRNEPLGYDKQLLADWVRKEFGN